DFLVSLDASAIAAVFGVECSLSGRLWRARGGDDRAGLALAQRFGLPEIIGRLLSGRGIGIENAEGFLAPTLREALPDPLHLKDMDKAVARLVDAVCGGELIGVFGDYDVDGATSSALLQRFFRAVGAKTTLYIPDRQREGYGPNAAALAKLKERGAGVVVTVDCGISSQEALGSAAESGLDVIVVDHHLGDPALPRALAVIDPNRVDEASPHGMLAAVGVTFLLVAGVNRALRQAGCYRERGEPDLMQLLDLVALGTVCDVVPLTGVNRALVAQGLKIMRRRGNIGLAALGDAAGIGEKLDAYHAGFILGPRVNAGGRVGEADLGARLLATEDPEEARTLAAHLHALNAERRAIEAQVLAQAIAAVERDPGGALVLAAGENWHPGVIGIVASRLKERYNRPACVVALSGGIGRGSGRSVPGLALGPIVIAAQQAGLLVDGRGLHRRGGKARAVARISRGARRRRTRRSRCHAGAAHRRCPGGCRRDARSRRADRAHRPVRCRQFRAALRPRQSARGEGRHRRYQACALRLRRWCGQRAPQSDCLPRAQWRARQRARPRAS